jgi:hypothetical protein
MTQNRGEASPAFVQHIYESCVKDVIESMEAGQVEQDIRPELIRKVAYYCRINEIDPTSTEGATYQMYDLLRVLADTNDAEMSA